MSQDNVLSRVARSGVTYFVLAALALVTLYPLAWMFFGSLKTTGEFYGNVWGPPAAPQFANYAAAWAAGDLGVKIVNSVIVTAGTLIVTVPLATLAAYAIARLRFPGRRALFYLFLFGIAVPQGVTAIPTLTVVLSLGLLNTQAGLVLVLAAQALSLQIFLMQAFFRSLPRELEEAAMIDGCSPLGAFARVIVPLTRPALATQTVIVGVGAWNEYFLTSILIRSQDLQTLPVGLVNFSGRYSTNYPDLFAALTIGALPMLILFVLAQRQFISGLTAGAVKG
jgi:raffinose/stachyose/melibiose transport system permease protein